MTTKPFVTRPDGRLEQPETILSRCRADPRRYGRHIRRLAGYDRLTARKSRRDGLWYIADATNRLVSPEQGLDDIEALEWLLQADDPA